MQLTKNAFLVSVSFWLIVSAVFKFFGADFGLKGLVAGGLLHVGVVALAFEIFTEKLDYRAGAQPLGLTLGMWVALTL